MTNAQYVRPSSPSNPNPADVVNTFNEKLTYDKNGNIQTLVRNGGMESQTTVPVMDNLVYGYDSNDKNKLLKVTDTTANTDGFKDGANTTEEYAYDLNGNMIRDDNKGISSIKYNHLNLPTRIVFQNGGDFPNISYIYTATGKKIAKTVNTASRHSIVYTVDYLDGYQYESGKLLFLPAAEGYVKYTFGVSNPFDYVFNYTDHLGNIRLSYGINPGTGLLTKIEENNYYPFGLKHATYNTEAKIIVPRPNPEEEAALSNKYMVQKIDVLAAEMNLPPMEMPPGELVNPEIYSGYNYKYNGKELQDELGLGMTAMDFRQYDNALGRFNSIDALSELSYSTSPFAFAKNNPVFWADPTGLISQSAIDAMWNNSAENASTTWTNNGGGNFDSSAGNGWVNAESGTFNEYSVSLPEVKVGSKSSNWASKFEQHTYDNSPFYKHDDPYKPTGDANAALGVAASGIESLSGLTRVGTNATFYTPGAAGRVFYGNQYVSTFGLAKIGTVLGRGSFAAGAIMDGVGVYNYYQNPTSSHVVSPAKMGLNTTMGYIGLEGGPPGAILSGIYFLGDAFIPGTAQEPGGGWPAAIEAGARNTEGNRAILGSSWSPRPCGGL